MALFQFTVVLFFVIFEYGFGEYYVQPWMCLQRCGWNTSDIEQHLQEIQNYSEANLINSVSFEKYNLGPNGTLVINNDLYDVTPTLQEYNVELWPMISSYPYPPEFLTWMRQLFNNQSLANKFINTCKQQAILYNYNGFNVDWEPQSGTPTEQDAQNYAIFLNQFAEEMHSINKQLSVDTATWNLIWNLTAISLTSIDYVITMNTYTNHYKTWINALNEDMEQINNWNEKLVVGLSTDNLTDNTPFSQNQLQMRFDALQQNDIHKIGIWCMPLDSDWRGLLQSFVNNATTN